MRPEKVPIKGPHGKDDEGELEGAMPEVQEKYEEEGEHVDLVGGEPTQDPTTLAAHAGDHTPNFTRGERQPKPEYGKFSGRGDGGVGV
jgi:hypothetical protein